MKRLFLSLAILFNCFLIWHRESVRLVGPTSFNSIVKRSWADNAPATTFSLDQLKVRVSIECLDVSIY